MSITSTSNLQSQTRPLQKDGTTLMTSTNYGGRDIGGNVENDRKNRIDGLECNIKEKDALNHGVDNKENVCIIDVRNNNNEEEKVCRICQLEDEHLGSGEEKAKLIQLGCSCKGELGVSHYHCALAWFRQKGNRTCEICGKAAKNVEGVEDTGFRVYGADISVIASAEIAMNSNLYERDHRCTKSFCNFMLAAFVLAFLVPWVMHPSRLW